MTIEQLTFDDLPEVSKGVAYCPFWKECATPCFRSLTKQVEAEHRKQGVVPKIMYTKPACFEPEIPRITGEQQ